MGRIGQTMARRALGFDMHVLYHDVARADPAIEKELGLEYVSMDTIPVPFVGLYRACMCRCCRAIPAS